eukprot:5789265-Pyramimonas_sp.AAC.1
MEGQRGIGIGASWLEPNACGCEGAGVTEGTMAVLLPPSKFGLLMPSSPGRLEGRYQPYRTSWSFLNTIKA